VRRWGTWFFRLFNVSHFTVTKLVKGARLKGHVGRPLTGEAAQTRTARLTDEFMAQVGQWAAKQPDKPNQTVAPSPPAPVPVEPAAVLPAPPPPAPEWATALPPLPPTDPIPPPGPPPKPPFNVTLDPLSDAPPPPLTPGSVSVPVPGTPPTPAARLVDGSEKPPPLPPLAMQRVPKETSRPSAPACAPDGPPVPRAPIVIGLATSDGGNIKCYRRSAALAAASRSATRRH
jgi:hypothetical protein